MELFYEFEYLIYEEKEFLVKAKMHFKEKHRMQSFWGTHSLRSV